MAGPNPGFRAISSRRVSDSPALGLPLGVVLCTIGLVLTVPGNYRTMLPGWKRVRHSKDKREEQLKNAVHLTKRWNHGLDMRAKNWKRGKIMLWDMNKWLLDAIRNEAKDGWYEVKEGCAKSSENVCERPEEFLMW